MMLSRVLSVALLSAALGALLALAARPIGSLSALSTVVTTAPGVAATSSAPRVAMPRAMPAAAVVEDPAAEALLAGWLAGWLAEEETLPEAAPAGRWGAAWAVAGLLPGLAAAAWAALRRRPADRRAALPVVPVDLEAGAPMYQSVLLREAGRPSLALGAKKGIHPEMYEAPVYCGGELVMTTNGTKKEYVVDIWSGNHPFYQNKGGVVVSDAGRLERFKNKYGKLGGLGSFGEVPTGTGPAVALKLEPKAKKKPGKK